MPEPALTPALAAFLRAHVDSLVHLEVLALMVKMPDRWWDPASAGRELGLDVLAARAALEDLASRNLMEIGLTTDVRYRLQPGTSELREACEAFADAYRTNPLAIARFVADTRRRKLKDFADAFRMRRHDNR